MSRYKIYDQFGRYFVTMTVVDWVDVFTRKAYRDLLLDSLRFCQQHKGLEINAYVIMTNHVHLIGQSTGDVPLSNILGDFKKFTAKAVLKAIRENGEESRKEWMLPRFAYRGPTNKKQRTYQFWKEGNHPIELYTLPVITQKIRYIHQNPVKAGWVWQAKHYPYSSAAVYAGEQGLLDIVPIDLMQGPFPKKAIER
jgi:putative transposase